MISSSFNDNVITNTKNMNMNMNMNKKNKKRKWNHKDNNNNSSGNDNDDGSIIISSSSLSSNNTSNNNTILQDIINPNFNHLASIYPEFAKQWIKLKQRRRKQLQYNNNNNQQQQQQQQQNNNNNTNQHNNSFSSNVDNEFNKSLSRAILKHYFQLSLPSIPNGYLCPPIPNRLNYILWIQNELLYQVYNCNNNNNDDDDDEDYFIWWNDNSSNDDNVYNDVKKKNGDNKNDNIIRKCKYQGIDIGIGASCIYPLLLCTKYFDNPPKSTTTTSTSLSSSSQWKILGTDIDPISIQCAQENINANNLQDRIKITLVPPTMDQKKSLAIIFNDGNGIDQGGNDDNGGNDQGSLKEEEYMTPIHAAMMAAKTISLNSSTSTTTRSSSSTTTIEIASQSNNNESHEHSFDFVMTNPPFYSQVDEATKPRIGDGRKRIDMTMFESVYPGQPIGGEVKFVLDMIHDSLKYRHDIIWFTAMLGKKSSYIPIEKELEKVGLGIGSIRKTEFVQGKTRRWGIGWTFLKPSLRSKGMQLSLFLFFFIILILNEP